MKLYYSPGACSLAPHIALAETGLAYEAVAVNLKTHTLADGSDYRQINPLGYVPFLVLDDGKTLSECAVLVQYIADQAPAKNLISMAGSMARYEQQEMLNIIATDLTLLGGNREGGEGGGYQGGGGGYQKPAPRAPMAAPTPPAAPAAGGFTGGQAPVAGGFDDMDDDIPF